MKKLELKTLHTLHVGKDFHPPKPLFHGEEGISYEKSPRLISLAEIDWDDNKHNPARKSGVRADRISILVQSLSDHGWVEDEQLPVVRKLKVPNERGEKYELAWGFHRSQSLISMFGFSFKMWFYVIECDDDTLFMCRMRENDRYLPFFPSTEKDIIAAVVKLVNDKKYCKKDKALIKSIVNEMCPYRDAVQKGRIVQGVMDHTGLTDPNAFFEWTKPKFQRWGKFTAEIPYVCGGESTVYPDGKKVSTFLCGEGYAVRAIGRLVKKRKETGGLSGQVIAYVKIEDSKGNTLIEDYNELQKARLKLLEDFEDTIRVFEEVTDGDFSWIKFAGFLPQDKTGHKEGVSINESWDKLVTPESVRNYKFKPSKLKPGTLDVYLGTDEL